MSRILALFLATFNALPLSAHEFWIDPVAHVVEPGEPVVAALRVGQLYEGSSMSFLPPNFTRFEIVEEGEVRSVEGRAGDRPALTVEAPQSGLLVVLHETTPLTLTWDAWEDFEAFVRHKDAAWTIARHREAGWPEKDFREVYTRHAKSLVAVGDGEGEDRRFGLEVELVALENPYTGEMTDGIDVALWRDGAPWREAQIEVFEKASDGGVKVATVRTDEEGRATVPVRSGYRYMLDAVALREAESDVALERGALWESLWANLTFAVP